MRIRPALALFATAAVTVLLAGSTPPPTPAEPEVAPLVDLCAVAAPSGPVSDSIVVEGEVGSPASVTLPGPLTIGGIERRVVVEGEGDPLRSDDLVDYAMTVLDAATGAQTLIEGYDTDTSLSVPAGSLAQYLGCAPVGSRIVVAVPETDQAAASVWVLDVLGTTPAHATGEDQKPVDGMPTVRLAETGAPTITLPGGEPPSKTRVAELKKGDGAVIAAGDSVIVQYTGVRWSTGEVFDSSWRNGAPTALVTTDLIPGYREALEGHTVGSQVLVVIPPRFAYGAGEINEEDLTGETLVFVIDILEAQPAA